MNYQNIDCMQGMKEYPDKYFELAIVDPPYGKRASRGKNGYGDNARLDYNDKWDANIPNADYFAELSRVSKNQIIWGMNYFINFLLPTNCLIIWDKIGDGKFKNPFAQVDVAWTSFNMVSKKITVVQQGFVNSNEITIHPTQKPIKLYQSLLNDYAKPNDKILDTHVGSGSSIIACLDMGFDVTGFELDKDYYEASMKRINNFLAQGKLFQ